MAIKGTMPPSLRQAARIAQLMDRAFRVPGTNFRFGLDALIGLIPGVGDLSTFAVSCYLLTMMAQNGASGFVMARMVLNVVVDTAIGSVPFIGDIFDFGFKSNTRNLRLMQEHFEEGRHRGGAWKVVVPIALLLFVFMGAILWLVYKGIRMLF